MRTALSVIKEFRRRLLSSDDRNTEVAYTDYLLVKELDKLLGNEKFVSLCQSINMSDKS